MWRCPVQTRFRVTAFIWSGIAATSVFLLIPLRVLAADHFQTDVSEIMQGTGGAAIASDPRTGRILAVWNRQVVFGRTFPPGSTAKIVASAMALENHLITPEEKLYCRRVPRLLGDAYHCSHPEALEPFTLATALANSCNYFYSELSTRISAATLMRGFTMFGLDGREGGHTALRIPSEPKEKVRAALGEAPVAVTPAELLMAYSAVATRGSIYRLHRRKTTSVSVMRTVRLQPATWQILGQGLEECVRSGTCVAAAVPGVRVAGKTGTASASDGSGRTHAWFAGYAPADSPEVAIVVLLNRGTGAHDAAPIAGRILRQYFSGRVAP